MRYCGQMSNMFEVHKISVAYQKSLKVFRLKAAILGLWFVKSMMFNCGNPRESKGTQGNLSWWPLTNDVNENDVNEKKGALTSKNGTNLQKVWNPFRNDVQKSYVLFNKCLKK